MANPTRTLLVIDEEEPGQDVNPNPNMDVWATMVKSMSRWAKNIIRIGAPTAYLTDVSNFFRRQHGPETAVQPEPVQECVATGVEPVACCETDIQVLPSQAKVLENMMGIPEDEFNNIVDGLGLEVADELSERQLPLCCR